MFNPRKVRYLPPPLPPPRPRITTKEIKTRIEPIY